jgi:Na+/H+ antiporter NhaD/arsenite permease-like protein
VLFALAALLDRSNLLTAAERTAPAFLTLAVVIAGGAIADRWGAFRFLATVVLAPRVPALLASASVLTFTALISGIVNLDVAAVVAPPLAVQVATRRGLNASRLVIATALTANATSFLLPTSNLTNLLVLDQSQISTLDYLCQGWAAWLLVTVITVACLALLSRQSTKHLPALSPRRTAARSILPTILDLLPMFVIASAVRALLAGGLTFHGGFLAQFVFGSLLAAGANNLPAAAAVRTVVTATPWATIWAMAMGPNLLVTGSVASIICRRSALDLGVRFDSGTFSVLGAAMLPLQFLAACAGLALVRLG